MMDKKTNIPPHDQTEKLLAENQLINAVNELRHQNEELRKSEERYHRMIAEIRDYAIILLDENGDIQNWNSGAEQIKGYQAEEIIGKNFEIFYQMQDRESGLPGKLIQEAVRSGRATHEGWRVRKDGSRFWGSIVITALHDKTGAIVGFSKVTRDLTERKQSEDRTQKYLFELESQNRELERFAYVASHDLQEPLRKIRTFIDVIGSNPDDSEINKRLYEKINLSAERMSQLIKAILNYSRLGKNDAETTSVDLNQLINRVIDDFEINIKQKNAIVRVDKLPTVQGNELQLGQLFSNIFGNALKFNNEQPEIKISGTLVNSDVIRDIPAGLDEGKYWEIVIEDNGIGFEQKYARQIFLLFQRLHGKQEYPGTGIGLALCKRIIENHNGFITATSETGKSTRFKMYFPYNG